MTVLNGDSVRRLLQYNPDTGDFIWRPRSADDFPNTQNPRRVAMAWNTAHAGLSPSTLSKSGYAVIGIRPKQYFAHRLAWLYSFGGWPDGPLDHINGNRADNRLKNLRVVDNQTNQRNASRWATNRSGVTGVYRYKPSTWRAFIYVGGRYVHLGNFREFDAAVSARKAAEREYGFHRNHGREKCLMPPGGYGPGTAILG